MSGKSRERLVDGDIVGIGSLKVARGRLLSTEDGRRVTSHLSGRPFELEKIVAVKKAVPQIQAQGKGRAVKLSRIREGAFSMGRGQHRANLRLALVEILLYGADKIVGERLYAFAEARTVKVDIGMFGRRQAIDQAHGPTAFCLSC